MIVHLLLSLNNFFFLFVFLKFGLYFKNTTTPFAADFCLDFAKLFSRLCKTYIYFFIFLSMHRLCKTNPIIYFYKVIKCYVDSA